MAIWMKKKEKNQPEEAETVEIKEKKTKTVKAKKVKSEKVKTLKIKDLKEKMPQFNFAELKKIDRKGIMFTLLMSFLVPVALFPSIRSLLSPLFRQLEIIAILFVTQFHRKP